MTLNSFKMLMAFAKDCGLNTMGDLKRYKEQHGLKTNDELVNALMFNSLERLVK